MATIDAIGGKPVGRAGGGRRTDSSGWRQFAPADSASDTLPEVRFGEVAALGLDGLLALQGRVEDTGPDAMAQRHGTSVLRALSALQRTLLTDGDPSRALRELADLSVTAPLAADAGLAMAVGAAILRARVELARHGR